MDDMKFVLHDDPPKARSSVFLKRPFLLILPLFGVFFFSKKETKYTSSSKECLLVSSSNVD